MVGKFCLKIKKLALEMTFMKRQLESSGLSEYFQYD